MLTPKLHVHHLQVMHYMRGAEVERHFKLSFCCTHANFSFLQGFPCRVVEWRSSGSTTLLLSKTLNGVHKECKKPLIFHTHWEKIPLYSKFLEKPMFLVLKIICQAIINFDCGSCVSKCWMYNSHLLAGNGHGFHNWSVSLLNGTQAMPALLTRMCRGRFFSLKVFTKSLTDEKEARSTRRYSTFSSFPSPTSCFIRSTA